MDGEGPEMTEPSIEEIVDEIEAVMDGLPPSQPKAFVGLSDDEKHLVLKLPIARALIASWRERGEAARVARLEEALKFYAEDCGSYARAALKGEP